MKRTYIQPQTIVEQAQCEMLLAASLFNKDITSNVGITGGGSDEGYDSDGRAKENFTSIWDNEW